MGDDNGVGIIMGDDGNVDGYSVVLIMLVYCVDGDVYNDRVLGLEMIEGWLWIWWWWWNVCWWRVLYKDGVGIRIRIRIRIRIMMEIIVMIVIIIWWWRL